MNTWVIYLVTSVTVLLTGTALFFFTLTRGALIYRRWVCPNDPTPPPPHPPFSHKRRVFLFHFQPHRYALILFPHHTLSFSNRSPPTVPAPSPHAPEPSPPPSSQSPDPDREPSGRPRPPPPPSARCPSSPGYARADDQRVIRPGAMLLSSVIAEPGEVRRPPLRA